MINITNIYYLTHAVLRTKIQWRDIMPLYLNLNSTMHPLLRDSETERQREGTLKKFYLQPGNLLQKYNTNKKMG